MSRLKVDQIITAAWLIPMTDAGTALSDHGVALNAERIVDVAPIATLNARYPEAEQLSLPHHVLMPGLINAHGHAAMSLFKGMADDIPLQPWLEKHIWPAEATHVDKDFVIEGSMLAAAEMLLTGTTCFSDMYFFPDACAETMQDIGMRTQLCFPILEFPTAWASNADSYINKGLTLFDRYKNSDTINIAFGPHAPYTVADSTFQRIATLAAEIDACIQIHLHETQQEVDNAFRESGQRPIERLEQLGILTPRTQCVHMTAINEDDIAAMKRTGANVIHCPTSNMKLASGTCPVNKLLSEGINIALGTDSAASNNSLDMFSEIRLSALLGKLQANSASALPAYDVLAMATINAAKALGLDDHIGSLEANKCADLIAVDIQTIESQPLFSPLSQLVYCSRPKVTDVWVNGRRQVESGRLKQIDTEWLMQRTQQWQERILSGRIGTTT